MRRLGVLALCLMVTMRPELALSQDLRGPGRSSSIARIATPVPPPDEVARASALLREQSPAAFSADADSAVRLRTARKFIDDSAREKGAVAWAMLEEATVLAMSCGDVTLVRRAAGVQSERYSVEPIAAQWRAVTMLEKYVSDTTQKRQLACFALSLLDPLLRAERYDDARAAGQIARRQAIASEDAALRESAVRSINDLHHLLNTRPGVAALNRDDQWRQGIWKLLVENDSKRAGEMLASATDEKWQRLGTLLNRGPTDVTGQLELAEQLWSLGQANVGLTRWRLEQRAADLYRSVSWGLPPVEQKLASWRSLKAMAWHDLLPLEPGLQATFFATPDLQRPLKSRVDDQVSFDFGDNAPEKGVPRNRFSARWKGYFVVDGLQSGLQLRLEYDKGARLYVDDELYIDDWNGERSSAEVQVDVVEPGAHSLVVEYHELLGAARVRLLWKLPGQEKFTLVPAQHLWHDPAQK